MKFGVNTQIWVAPFEQSDIDLIDKVASLGFDVIELGFFSADPPFKVADVKQRLKDTGLSAGICSFLSSRSRHHQHRSGLASPRHRVHEGHGRHRCRARR